MKARLHLEKSATKSYQALVAMDKAVSNCGIEHPLLYLIYLRVSQINGCAYCTDMHWKDARHEGLAEGKLALVTCWRDAPGFTDRERAALDWAEAVTDLGHGHVPDSAFERAHAAFSEAELGNLTIAIAAMNLWNRLGIAFRMVAGEYQAGAAA
jgi:AhpD family alkylhydroperoxidase